MFPYFCVLCHCQSSYEPSDRLYNTWMVLNVYVGGATTVLLKKKKNPILHMNICYKREIHGIKQVLPEVDMQQ